MAVTGRRRHTVSDLNSALFFQLPQFLFRGELLDAVSNDAKVLYALLKNRHELSLRNGWANDKGEVYVIFSREEMQRLLGGKSENTVVKAVKNLKQYRLIEEERQGMGRPNLIYLLTVVDDELPSRDDSADKDPQNLRVRPVNFADNEPQHFRGNKNYSSKNNSSKNHSVYPATDRPTDTIDSEWVMEELKERLEYDCLCERNDRERVDELVNIVYDTLLAAYSKPNGSIYIGQAPYPASAVIKRFETLNFEHIEGVIENMDANTTEIRNIHAYLLTALYKAPSTTKSKFEAQFNHDMPEFAKGAAGRAYNQAACR